MLGVSNVVLPVNTWSPSGWAAIRALPVPLIQLGDHQRVFLQPGRNRDFRRITRTQRLMLIPRPTLMLILIRNRIHNLILNRINHHTLCPPRMVAVASPPSFLIRVRRHPWRPRALEEIWLVRSKAPCLP